MSHDRRRRRPHPAVREPDSPSPTTATLVVPVIDRGPYSGAATLDLTHGAALELGITETVSVGMLSLGGPPLAPRTGTRREPHRPPVHRFHRHHRPDHERRRRHRTGAVSHHAAGRVLRASAADAAPDRARRRGVRRARAVAVSRRTASARGPHRRPRGRAHDLLRRRRTLRAGGPARRFPRTRSSSLVPATLERLARTYRCFLERSTLG